MALVVMGVVIVVVVVVVVVVVMALVDVSIGVVVWLMCFGAVGVLACGLWNGYG